MNEYYGQKNTTKKGTFFTIDFFEPRWKIPHGRLLKIINVLIDCWSGRCEKIYSSHPRSSYPLSLNVAMFEGTEGNFSQ